MDIDLDAGTCVFVAERDNTVAIVIGLVLLDEEISVFVSVPRVSAAWPLTPDDDFLEIQLQVSGMVTS